MTADRAAEILPSGEVATLQRRLDGLEPVLKVRLREMADATDQAAALTASGDARGAEQAQKRAARLRTEVATLNREVETLRSLVAARVARGHRS